MFSLLLYHSHYFSFFTPLSPFLLSPLSSLSQKNLRNNTNLLNQFNYLSFSLSFLPLSTLYQSLFYSLTKILQSPSVKSQFVLKCFRIQVAASLLAIYGGAVGIVTYRIVFYRLLSADKLNWTIIRLVSVIGILFYYTWKFVFNKIRYVIFTSEPVLIQRILIGVKVWNKYHEKIS